MHLHHMHMTSHLPPASTPRLMREHDLPAVISLQSQCYRPEFHEPEAAFASKLRAAPESCWVQEGPEGLQAYMVCLPMEGGTLPALHAPDWHRPPNPDWLYLHDLAIHPAMRAQGLAGLMVGRANELALQQKMAFVGLIAVQGSQPFWARHGFDSGAKASWVPPEKLASFGEGATFMLRRLEQIGCS